jgi:hypothetical protein
MSEPAVAAGNPISSTRIVGGTAIALAVSGFVQNAVFGSTGAPAYSDPPGVVLTYHAENWSPFAIISGLEAVNEASGRALSIAVPPVAARCIDEPQSNSAQPVTIYAASPLKFQSTRAA